MQENVKQVIVKMTARRAFRTEPIYQYDVGHELVFEGFDGLPATFQVDYSLSPTGKSIQQIGQNGVCVLPDMFTQTAAPIYAWLYIADTETGLTKYSIEIPVQRRAKPTDQQPTPVEQSAIDQAIAALNDGVEAAEDAQEAAEAAQAGAETAQGQAEDAATRAANSAIDADSSRRFADQSASDASISERNAKASEENAAESERKAKASEEAAKAAVDQYDDMTATATGLAAGSTPTAEIDHTGAAPVLRLGIPKGDKGDPGDPGDPTELIDDTAGSGVTNKTWSADKLSELNSALNELSPKVSDLEINKADVIINTASGSIASFPDGADGMPVKELTVAVKPVQDLHGQDVPYPPGVRKNKFNIKDLWDNGTTVSNGDTEKVRYIRISVPSGTYTCSTNCPNNTTATIASVFITNTYTDAPSSSASGVFLNTPRTLVASDEGYLWVYIRVQSQTYLSWNEQSFAPYYIQVESGSTATSYAPYSNLCPIYGWTGANVWDDPKYGGLIEWNQTIEKTTDHYYAVVGSTKTYDQETNTVVLSATGNSSRLQYNPFQSVQNHVYLVCAVLSLDIEGVARFEFSRGWTACSFNNVTTTPTWRANILKPTSGNDNYGYCQWFRSTNDAYTLTIKDFQVFDLTKMFGETKADEIYAMEQAEAGSGVAYFRSLFPANYYPYNVGETTTVSAVNGDPYKHVEIEFPSEAGTVYDSSLTVFEDGTGKLVVDSMYYEVDGSTNYFNLNGAYANIMPYSVVDGIDTTLANWICSLFPPSSYYCGYNVNNKFVYLNRGAWERIGSTSEELNAYATLHPIQFVIPLITPVEYQLTNLEVLTLLKGANHIWADTGDTTVTYRADTKLYIDNRITQAIAAALNA